MSLARMLVETILGTAIGGLTGGDALCQGIATNSSIPQIQIAAMAGSIQFKAILS